MKKNEKYIKFKFGELCVKMGFMTQEQIEFAISKQEISKERIGNICVRAGLIDDEQLAMIIATQYYHNYLELESITDPEILNLIPAKIMAEYKCIPYEKIGNTLVIAVAEPMEFMKVADSIEALIDMPISIVVASEKRIRAMLKKKEADQSVLETVSDDMRLLLVKDTEKGEETLSLEKVSSEESPIVRLVDSTILDAINKKASDIHIESTDQGVIIRFRIDGMLHQATEPIAIQHQSFIISRIKVMSELDISEKRIPQDGRFKLKVRDRYVDFRVSIIPTIYGEDVVIRILDRETLMPEGKAWQLSNMNFPERELIRIRKLIHAPYGMFLVTGPTGSGKTTTLYMAVSEVNKPNEKLITIEDPVEYQLEGIVQIQVNEKKGLTFAKGLRAILRHDPDKIRFIRI